MNNFEESIWNWIEVCPFFSDLFFMVVKDGVATDKETVIAPEISGNQPIFVDGKGFIDGSGTKEYMCNIGQFINMSTVSNSTDNIDSWESIKKLQEWILLQIEQDNLPQWEYPIEDIMVTGAMQAGYDESSVKGQFQIVIKYLYSEGE